MKNILIVLMTLLSSYTYANEETYKKMITINKCWLEQKGLSPSALPSYKQLSEKEWIRVDLSLVEAALRRRCDKGLNARQRQNRLHCLDILHRYWQEGNFPINEDYSFRTPIFIDKHDNFCAVGYLLKATGHEHISRMIAANMNLAYVRELHYTELITWANENGLTVDELAWIQPGYPPGGACSNIGGGVDGSVNELFVDTAKQRMYVGGSFYQVDKTIVANNIAYVTEAAGIYTWHNLGMGVNGTVNAVAKHDGKLFVAGSFSAAGGTPVDNVAYWDDSFWHSAGCIDGSINDLLEFEGKLYAAGNFKSCGADAGKNFARWDDTVWTTIAGLEGHINTMEVVGNSIALGGAFNYDTSKNVNAIRWNTSTSFQNFDNKVSNEVMDFELYQDTLYLACKKTSVLDSNYLFSKLSDNIWEPGFDEDILRFGRFNVSHDTLAFRTLCSESSSMDIGGHFSYWPFLGTGANNLYRPSFWVDSTVNKMVLFKNQLILGGAFKKGSVSTDHGLSMSYIDVNGIARRLYRTESIPAVTQESNTLYIYPNPGSSEFNILGIDKNQDLEYVFLYSIDNKQLKKWDKPKLQTRFAIDDLEEGIYIIYVIGSNQSRQTYKLIVHR
jgi:hypothetical protein